jgi:hypothetical protein
LLCASWFRGMMSMKTMKVNHSSVEVLVVEERWRGVRCSVLLHFVVTGFVGRLGWLWGGSF